LDSWNFQKESCVLPDKRGLAPRAPRDGFDVREVARMKASPEFRKQLAGYGLTTAEILYRMPDHPSLLQSYIWQDYDVFPEFPTLRKFLDFWTRTLEGPLFKVTVGHCRLIKPAELKAVGAEFRLH
jgi:uncharacterized protein Usg